MYRLPSLSGFLLTLHRTDNTTMPRQRSVSLLPSDPNHSPSHNIDKCRRMGESEILFHNERGPLSLSQQRRKDGSSLLIPVPDLIHPVSVDGKAQLEKRTGVDALSVEVHLYSFSLSICTSSLCNQDPARNMFITSCVVPSDTTTRTRVQEQAMS